MLKCNKMKKTGNTQFRILPQFVDFREQASLGSMMDLILTASGINADENGFGIRDLSNINGTWVLSRFAMELDYFPKQYETIRIETWVHQVHTSNTIRNFRIINSKNEVFGYAISVWAVIDVSTRRPIPMSQLEKLTDFIIPETTAIDKPLKLNEVLGEPFEVGSVKYSDIDINQHVNTKNYIRWMADTFSLEEMKNRNIRRLDLNFLNEMRYGNYFQLFKEQLDADDFRFDIKTNNKTACRGRIRFDN